MFTGGIMGIFSFRKARNLGGSSQYDPVAAYQRHLDSKFKLHGSDRDLAFADAIGSISVDLFRMQGDTHVAVLLHHGLQSGMTVFDLGCGCGRTAQALQRSGWKGRYIGTDIIPAFIEELKAKCPGFEGYVNIGPTIRAQDESLDMLYHWSVFTHVPPEECFLYMQESYRALKPGGKMIFSFLEFANPEHWPNFMTRVRRIEKGKPLNLLDTFLHRDWIALWAEQIGFTQVAFTDGSDATNHPPFWQTLVAMTKAPA
jgi:ubiquinone/menaquinone biosynthesis C-methylase UbiE